MRLLLDVRENATVVPTKAIIIEKGGAYVFVIRPDSTAERRMIELGPEVNNKTIVERGLVPGEYIVTEGYHKLSHGDRALPLLNTGDDAAPAAAEPVEEGAGSVAAPMGEAAAGEGVEAPAADSATVKAASEGAPAAEKGDSIKK